MLDELGLVFRSDGGKTIERLKFAPSHMTVFVGPNDSGKSQILREIHTNCSEAKQPGERVILEAAELQSLTEEEVDELLAETSGQPYVERLPNEEFRIVRHEL